MYGETFYCLKNGNVNLHMHHRDRKCLLLIEKNKSSLCISRYQLTTMVVDTEAGPHKNHTVLFLGSTRGTVLKFLMIPTGEPVSHRSVFLEEVEGFNPEK